MLNISTQMMDKLTDDIMDLSKIKEGVFSLNEKNFNISTLVEEITFIFETQCQLKGISFEVICDEFSRNQSFCSDKGRISQILINFISNSLKFTTQGCVCVKIEVIDKINSDSP